VRITRVVEGAVGVTDNLAIAIPSNGVTICETARLGANDLVLPVANAIYLQPVSPLSDGCVVRR
jgi:hypothetical protein